MIRSEELRQRASIGILTALPQELAAVRVMLENPVRWTAKGHGGGREYWLGEIPSEHGGSHAVAVALLSDMGNNSASMRATNLLHHFSAVEHIIMCGIAGGIPSPDKLEDDVRLGDVVVSNRNGVVQYDLVKEHPDGAIEHRHPPRPPAASLLDAVRHLETEELLGTQAWVAHLPRGGCIKKASRPADNLNAKGEQINYLPDPARTPGVPRVFAATVAAANTLLKKAARRDYLGRTFGVKAVEMEGSGVADAAWMNDRAGYLVVRGICDYCDGQKGDLWQGFAAVAAAAYVRALIASMAPPQLGQDCSTVASERHPHRDLPPPGDLTKQRQNTGVGADTGMQQIECAFKIDRSAPHRTRLAGLSKGCQFGTKEFFRHEGEYWCAFHLPQQAKSKWTAIQKHEFNEKITAIVEFARRNSTLLDLCGVTFPGPVAFGRKGSQLALPNALFMGCVFSGDVTFENLTFSGWVYFNRSHFQEQALLYGAQYLGEACFNYVDFGHNVHLGDSTFEDNAYFQCAKFPGNAWCSDVNFAGRAWFQEAALRGIAYFERCTFGGEADFSTRQAENPQVALSTITFEGSTFQDRVCFTNRPFSDSTSFANTVFHVAPEFHGCRFHQDTDLSGTTFLDKGDVKRAPICGVWPQAVDAVRAYRTLKHAMETLRNFEDEARFRTLEQEALRGIGGKNTSHA